MMSTIKERLLCFRGISSHLLPFLLLAMASSSLFARTYYVDVVQGSDKNIGSQEAPFRTTGKAINTVHAGDTIMIVKVDHPIHESITIHNRSGDPGRPIVIDGNGNTFTGADALHSADWTEIRPGVYQNDHLIPDLKAGTSATAATIQRYFMMWNGNQNRMGRSSKGIRKPLVAPDQLQPGEWTYDDLKTTFYIAIDPKKKLDDYHIETPLRQNGVGLGGICKHWVIRNFNIRHVINDGFNIHGHTEDVVFENITATECGDDGISAHEDCTIAIHGFVARRNSTGMCHGDFNVTCIADRLVLEENYGYNLLLWTGTTEIANSIISAAIPPGGHEGVRLKNQPKAGSPEQLTAIFRNCNFPFTTQPAATGNPALFVVNKTVNLKISEDCKMGGNITYLP